MIIRFSVENWMSFRNETSFSMIASRETQHDERVPKLKKYRTRVLPIAAIYGGNASGKTNFFQALNFAKKLVVGGTPTDSPILREPFRLDDDALEQPSYFMFELLIDEIIYEFSFAVTDKRVVEEKLVQIKSSSERIIYNRQGDEPNFDASISEDDFVKFVFKGTRDNQLFLTNSISQQIEKASPQGEIFRKIYNWFRDNLVLVAPDSRFREFENFLDEGHFLHASMNEILPQLDTGISRLGRQDIPFEAIPLTEVVRTKIQKDMKEGESVTIRLVKGESGKANADEHYVITRKNNEWVAKKLVTYHKKLDGTETMFEIKQESDGSQRIINLLPVFLEASADSSKKVFIVDEVNRSLHSLLTKKLIEGYLTACSEQSRSQLLMTTHDVLLMDQQLLRRDEMWVAERDESGISSLIAFSDYKDIRSDKDIRKSYLQGRLGGIPRILLNDNFAQLSSTQDDREDG